VKAEMGQEGSDAWTISIPNFSSDNDYAKSYECEIHKNNNDNYSSLYSAKEYKAEILKVEIGTEPEIRIKTIMKGLEIDRKGYED